MAETTCALTHDELLFEYQRVSHELAQLRRLIFGQKRERFVPVVNEQQLAIALMHRLPPLLLPRKPSPTRADRKNLPTRNHRIANLGLPSASRNHSPRA